MMDSSAFIALTYFLASGVAILFVRRTSKRNRRLFWPMMMNLLLGAVVLSAVSGKLAWLVSLETSGYRQEIFVAFVLLILFVLAVELPGFLLNTAYDRRVVNALDELEEALLAARLNPHAGIVQLANLLRTREVVFSEARVQAFAAKCVEEFKRINNANTSLIEALQRQVEAARNRIIERSKHPFPIIAQILGLSTVGFILAEILATLRAR